jgi:tRNA uridine 5-carbamoylmethylation protein Kti12
MFLKSMRREIYKTTRDVQVPLVVIYIKTSLATCLERNANRTGPARIEEHSILNITEKFEAPMGGNIADKHFIVIDNEHPKR